ncbi:hypothetical protein [uncultured Sneathiella sp.]|jgi:hypothetical protein|uniref:hypothetical protein n=1 Tax=uncultured Sneathiella sp. TaxID=879315 RepID=UPI0030DA0DCC|tara:strand:+ start:1874 stop:3343 length:1470 start_codon:yes stop_codon:yes gene_type:complete
MATPSNAGGPMRLLPERWDSHITSVKGVLLITMAIASGCQGIFGMTWLKMPVLAGMILYSIMITLSGTRVVRIFLLLGLICIPLTFTYVDDAWQVINEGTVRAQLFLSFFTAIMVLREPAFRSPLLQEAGKIIVRQTQMRRVLLLLLGSHLFGLMMNMGSVVLLGSIASTHNKKEGADEPDFAQRQSALAIIQGFVSTLMWSPLSLAPIVVVSLMPGLTSSTIISLGLIGALLLFILSFVVSQLEIWLRRRQEIAVVPEVSRPEANSFLKILVRVLLLVVTIFSAITFLSMLASVGIAVAVTLAIPFIAFIWLLVQTGGDLGACLRGPVTNMIFRTLPLQSSEVGILMVAGFMGPVLVSLMPSAEIVTFLHSHHVWPGLIVLASFFAIVVGGVVAVNPLISVTIVLGVIADPIALGIHPVFLAMSILTAWAVASELSPFTGVSLVTAGMFGVKSTTLTLVWNRLFGIITLTICTIIILIVGELTALPIP